jgi:hypothetical protein
VVALLNTDDVERLAKPCGMFGSDHVGERATAAQMANKLVRARGLTWSDVIAPTPTPRSPPTTSPWQRMVRYCLQYGHLLTERQIEFVRSLLRWRGELTERQENWLIDIYTRIRDEARQ